MEETRRGTGGKRASKIVNIGKTNIVRFRPFGILPWTPARDRRTQKKKRWHRGGRFLPDRWIASPFRNFRSIEECCERKPDRSAFEEGVNRAHRSARDARCVWIAFSYAFSRVFVEDDRSEPRKGSIDLWSKPTSPLRLRPCFVLATRAGICERSPSYAFSTTSCSRRWISSKGRSVPWKRGSLLLDSISITAISQVGKDEPTPSVVGARASESPRAMRFSTD